MTEDEIAAASAAEAAVAADAAAAPVVTDSPWHKEAEARFTDPTARAAFDSYMREVNAPYVTKLEQDRAEAQRAAAEAVDKAWVLDAINEDPAAAIADIFSQVYGEDASARVSALIAAGFSVEDAGGIVEQEETLDLDKLPAEVREAVEYAQTQKAAQAAAEVAAAQQAEIDSATTEYDAWRAELLKSEPDIKESTLHRYVLSADVADDATAADLFKTALAAYREDFPSPAGSAAPATLGPGGGSGPAAPGKPRTLAEAADRIWSAGASNK